MASRIEALARPKPNLLKYPDRRSVYWLDALPSEKNGPTTFALSPRLSQLCQFRRLNSSFQEDRPSPVWTVSTAALRALPSERLQVLARPQAPSLHWMPDRPLVSEVSEAVLRAVPSARVCQLAQPKRLAPLWASAETSGDPSLSEAPRCAGVSPRIDLLATPKAEHRLYRPDRDVAWPVPRSARAAVASDRLLVLAKPRARRALSDGCDPYRVSSPARRAQATPRTLELSAPLARKQRQKKA
ncbi:sperm microtubule associated protein 2 [Lepisosteus oculatus]|uniref:sperm microtubule associated protein 2 n=1 Tax=Lepisosteus oculatus TaxID=7918 RepID=UPI0037230658